MSKAKVLFYSFIAAMCLFLPSGLKAEQLSDAVSISGQVRLRSEVDDRSFNSANKADNYSLLRTRIGLSMELADNVKSFVQFQDSRRLGSEPSTLGSTSNLDLHQGYIQLDNLLGATGLTMKAGRMEIAFGGERLIGPVGWSNVGRSFDGARLYYENPDVRAEVWGATLNDRYESNESRDNSIAGLDLEIGRKKAFAPRFYLIAERNNKRNPANDKMLSRQTFGVHLIGESSGFNYDIEAALQRGSLGAADISTSLFALDAGYRFNDRKSRLGFGLDYLSGDDNPADNKINTFNTLYATNHKFYGYMDYFTNIPAQTNGLGLVDIMLKAQTKLHPKVLLKGDFHIFRYAEDNAAGENSLGNELDLTLVFNTRKNYNAVLGFSVFSPGDAFKSLKGDETAYWLYSMLTVSF